MSIFRQNLFIKIDAQGFEWEVINGTEGLFERVSGFQIEMSLIGLYYGQKLFSEIHNRLVNAGFSLWGLDPVFGDVHKGRLYQFDAVYFKDGSD